MANERKEIKCPWCGQAVPVPEVKIAAKKSDYADVKERRCPKCGKILAAYIENEGNFLPRIRTF